LGRNQVTAKSHNIRSILKALLYHQQISRVELAELTGLTTATISNLVNELLSLGLVRENGFEQVISPRVGRPRRTVELIPGARFAIGVHIGIGEFQVVITDLLANIVSSTTRKFELCTTADVVIQEIVTQINNLIIQSGISKNLMVGIGVGASGLVNVETGMNINAPNLCWQNIPIREWIHQGTGLPVIVDNNVRLMCLAEAMFGEGKTANVMAFVYARVGVGAGLFVNGKLFRGMAAGAGEIGHSIMIPDGGEKCSCGNYGCLETLVSQKAILRSARQLAEACPTGIVAKKFNDCQSNEMECLFSAAQDGDQEVLKMLAEKARYFGIALANLINVLNPNLIVLGGILGQGEEFFLPEINKVVKEYAFSHLGDQVRICVSGFGQKTGVIGASALALSTYFYDLSEIPEQEKSF
jgi:glucokinase-like ROK family protein